MFRPKILIFIFIIYDNGITHIIIEKKIKWDKLIEKKIFEIKINWKNNLIKKNKLKKNILKNFIWKKKLNTENVNSFFKFTFFPQIYKLRQPFINQKNYQTSFYDSF